MQVERLISRQLSLPPRDKITGNEGNKAEIKKIKSKKQSESVRERERVYLPQITKKHTKSY